MKDAVEGRSSPVLTWQGEDSSEVVEGDVALRKRALQAGFLEGGPLLLQGPGTAQITLKEKTEYLNEIFVQLICSGTKKKDRVAEF